MLDLEIIYKLNLFQLLFMPTKSAMKIVAGGTFLVIVIGVALSSCPSDYSFTQKMVDSIYKYKDC